MAYRLNYLTNGTFTGCPSVNGPETGTWNAISSSNPIARPGVLGDGSGAFFTVNEGLLAVFDYPNNQGGYRIVMPATGKNVYKFMESISYLTVYGNQDEGLTAAQKKQALRGGRLAMRCEQTIDVVLDLMGDDNMTGRKVRLLDPNGSTGYDDGHVVCEAMVGGAWKLFDVAKDRYYTYQGAHMSALDLYDHNIANAVPVILCPGEVAYKNPATGFKTASYMEAVLPNEAALATWSQRIYGAYGWQNGTETWWISDGLSTTQKNYITGLSSNYKLKTRAQIASTFY